MTDNPQHNDKPTPARKRGGCTCGTVLLYGVFIIVGLVIIGHMAAKEYFTRQALATLSASDRADFEAWQNRDIEVPAGWFTSYPANAAEIEAAKQKLANEIKRVSSGLPVAVLRMTPGHEIRQHTIDDLAKTAAAVEPLFAQAKALTEMPGYTFSPVSTMIPFDNVRLSQYIGPLHAPVTLAIIEGRHDEAVEKIDVLLGLNHLGPVNIGNYNDEQTLHVITVNGQNLGNMTSDTQTLRALLDTLNRHRDGLQVVSQDIGVAHGLAGIREMVHEGYIDPPAGNVLAMREFQQYLKRYEGFRKHLYRTISPSDYRYSYLDTILNPPKRGALTASSGGPLTFQILTRVVSTPGLSNLYRWGMSTTSARYEVMSFQREAELARKAKDIQAEYDLLRLWLARRIAELDGKPLPTTEADMVPHYLTTWPADPWSTSGAGYQFSPEKGEFQTVGPGARP